MTLSGVKTSSTPSALTTKLPIPSPRLYEQQDDEDDDHDTKHDLTRETVIELEEEVGVPADTYLFDSWFAHDSGLPDHIESYDRD